MQEEKNISGAFLRSKIHLDCPSLFTWNYPILSGKMIFSSVHEQYLQFLFIRAKLLFHPPNQSSLLVAGDNNGDFRIFRQSFSEGGFAKSLIIRKHASIGIQVCSLIHIPLFFQKAEGNGRLFQNFPGIRKGTFLLDRSFRFALRHRPAIPKGRRSQYSSIFLHRLIRKTGMKQLRLYSSL